MTNEPSPRPWHFNGMRPTIYSDEKLPDGSARVVLDIETDHLPLLPCDENDRRLIADLALIVEAVNEYEELAAENNRLRKEVGRLRSAVKLLDAAAGPYCAPELRPVLIAEARAALGEDKE